ncbi:MAG TPA: hypothetical protein VEI06_16060 [Gemmatimonadaceae bacterium]|nr:hypothetical protein [Gemmatimonadaceae bacterium]
MANYEFSLSSPVDRTRRAGVVRSDSFAEALELIAEEGDVGDGDRLEIGVRGFPPAKYIYFLSALGEGHGWYPTDRRAA